MIQLKEIAKLLGQYLEINEAKQDYAYLSAEAKKVADDLIKLFGISKDEIKAHAKNRVMILSDLPRNQVFDTLAKAGYTRDSADSRIAGSSAGGFRSESGVEILHKPLNQHLSGGAGVANEKFVYEMIDSILQETSPLNVVFEAGGKKLVYRDVTKVGDIGKIGETKGWKGDLALVTPRGTQHISIKQDGHFRWESTVKRFRSFYEAFMNKAIQGEIKGLTLVPSPDNNKLLMMINPQNNKPYGRVYIEDHPDLAPGSPSVYEMAFGTDHAKVVQRTFSANDFEVKGSTLTIQVSKILENVNDISKEDFPILEFERNASKAYSAAGIYGRGIIMRSIPSYIKNNKTERANILVVKYKDVMQ